MKRTRDQAAVDDSPIHNIVIGTAGHIDHGKTALIERLTGIDADRLPEEKERGMTIDLGFARLRLRTGRRVGIVDVPGHERFIKNMVAGATGIDLVLLVVAADDGVMPQTREHLEIMKLLGLRHGIIVVTKIDLVPDDLRELAIEDVRETVEGTFLEDAPIQPVSSVTGEGIDELVDRVHECVNRIEPRSAEGVFRMPIQRVFSSKGFGTVLTGIPVSGQTKVGDTIEVLPLEQSGRIRGIHAYMSVAEVARAGQSSALNVTDVDYRAVHRGMVVAAPAQFRHSKMLEARLHYLAGNQRPLRQRTRIRVHVGTAEVLGVVYLLEDRLLEPGASGLVQLRLDEPVVAVPGDRFIVRLHSPMVTIGGGEILDLSRWRLKSGKRYVIDQLHRKESALSSPSQVVLNAIEERGFDAVPEASAGEGRGFRPEKVREIIAELLEAGSLRRASRAGHVISTRRFEEAREAALAAARKFFDDHPRRLLMEKTVLRQAIRGHDVFFNDLLEELRARGELEVRGEVLQWEFHKPRLSEREASFRDALLEAMRSSLFAPPRVEEVAEKESFPVRDAHAISELLLEEGALVKLTDEILLHGEALGEARRLLREHLESEGTMTASQAKNWLGSSRKYVIPLLELLDREGFTIRRGDVRELRKRAE